MTPSTRGIALEAIARTTIVGTAVTADHDSAGIAISDVTNSLSVLLANVGNFPFEYQVNSGDWKVLSPTQIDTLAISLATSTLKLRKGEFSGNGLAELAIESLTGEILGDTGELLPAFSKASVGLGNVDNTSDATKPVSGLQQAAIDAAQVSAVAAAAGALATHSADHANPHAVTKSQVGLGSVDNTADSAKPVSTPQQTALNLKLDKTGGTLSGPLTLAGDAVSANQPVTKNQLDNASLGVSNLGFARLRTVAALSPANTYANGTAGVGATLTASSNGTLTVDGTLVALNDVICVGDEVAQLKNGLYLCTQAGSAGQPYILTRATNLDQAVEVQGAFVTITAGATKGGGVYWTYFTGTFTMGTTALTWTQSNAAPTSTDVVTEGSTNKYFTDARAVAAPLTGLDTNASNVAIASTDTSLLAFGKIRKRLEQTVTDVGAAASNLSAHTADVDNPHEVTKEQVGLDKVENLAPADMPVSSAVDSRLDAVEASVTQAADLGTATGFLFTSKIKMPNGQSLDSYLASLVTGQAPSASDPVVQTAPQLAGSAGAGVSSVLTLTAGTVVDGSGGSSALDWGAGTSTNATRRYTTAATTALNDTTGWAIGCWIRSASVPPASDQIFIGFGVADAASSFQLKADSGVGKYGVHVRDASGAMVPAAVVYPAAGDYLLVAQYSDTIAQVRFYLIAKNATVSGPSDASAATLATVTPGAGWYLGSDNTSWTKCPAGEFFVINRILTNGELTTLATGVPITSIVTPQLYWPFRSGASGTEVNLGSVGSADATRVGSGYTTTTVFFGANPHLNVYTFQLTLANGVVVDLFTETKSGTTSTFPIPAFVNTTVSTLGGFITGYHYATDTLTGRPSNTKASNVLGPITGTKPSGGVPTISPSGSQPGGTSFTGNCAPSWTTPNGANTYRSQWLLDGANITNYVAGAAPTLATTVQQAGQLRLQVIATSSIGIDSDPVLSAAVTLTGAPTFSFTSPLTLPAHAYIDQQVNFTPAVGNLGGAILLGYDVYLNGVQIRSLNQVAYVTPKSVDDSAVAGQTLQVIQRVTYNGAPYQSTASITLEATPATLVATTVTPSVVVSAGTTNTFTPTSASGGTGAKTAISISPALPGTYVLNSNGSISGSYGANFNATQYTITWRDSATPTPATATATFTLSVSAVSALSALTPTNVSASGHDESYTGQTITGSTSGANASDGIVRVQQFASIRGTGKRGWTKRVKNGDALLFSGVRSEFDVFSGTGAFPSAHGVDYWYGAAFFPFSGEWPGDTNDFSDQCIFLQIHQASSSVPNNGPTFALKVNAGDNSMRCEGNYGDVNPQNNSRDIFNAGQDSNFTINSWNRLILHLRFGSVVGDGPLVQLWHARGAGAYVKTMDVSGASALMGGSTDGGKVARIGKYKWTSTSWGSIPSRAFDHSDLFAGIGLNLFNETDAALAAFAV